MSTARSHYESIPDTVSTATGETTLHIADDMQIADGADSPAAPCRSSSEVAPGPQTRRTVLVIASRFPPVASVGATRIRKFAKYLQEFGWRPVIITGAVRRSRPNAHDARRAVDEESLLDLPENLSIHRLSGVLDNWPGHLTRWASARLGYLTSPFGLDEGAWRGKLDWRLRRLHDRLAFPDRGIWRLPSAVNLATKLHRRYRFDAVFSSGMPFSDHMIGLAIRQRLNLPWLADFRDPWVEYIHWVQWKGPRGRKLTRMAEASVIKRASHVISVNEHMTGRFRSRYEDQPTAKFVTIQNGYDPIDFKIAPTRHTNRRFRLLHAGSLYDTRSPDAVLEAFHRFIETVPGSQEHARFEFIGRPGPHMNKLAQSSPDATVQYLGMFPHKIASRMLAEADVNVVILPNLPGSANDTTAKIYECIGSNRPILAVVPPDGAAAAALRRFDGVSLCDPDDVEAIRQAIETWYRRWLADDVLVRRRPEDLAPLTRRHQAGQLAALLNAAATTGRSASRRRA